jgi:signal transduction histidine kinase
MPPGNSWLLITLQAPFWAAILIGLVLILAIGLAGIRYWRLSRRQEKLLEELRESRAKQSVPAAPSITSSQDAYIQFIHNISHEVSNPLQSIQTNLDNMAGCTPQETVRWQQYLAIITTEIRRLRDLTENLRMLSRLETPDVPVKREPVNIKGVIEAVMMAQVEVAEAKRVRLVYNGPERPARVLGDRDHLYRVLNNLVDNSVKYARPEGGEVIIAVQEADGRMAVRVSDDGIGIPPEDLPYVFEMAYRMPHSGNLRKAGSGLGLAIVKRIVEQHGGVIQIESQPGQGTSIVFDLPLYLPG